MAGDEDSSNLGQSVRRFRHRTEFARESDQQDRRFFAKARENLIGDDAVANL